MIGKKNKPRPLRYQKLIPEKFRTELHGSTGFRRRFLERVSWELGMYEAVAQMPAIQSNKLLN